MAVAAIKLSAHEIPTLAPFPADRDGAQSLLRLEPPRANYLAQGTAVALYALLLGLAVSQAFKPNEVAPVEEQTVELAPIPVDEEPPPDQPQIEQPDLEDLPPPPLAMDPIAPIEEIKPAPKPKPKPIQKVEKKVTPKPVAAKRDARPAPTTPRAAVSAPAVRTPAAALGATPSVIANHFHACMQRAASNAYPESQAPRTAHISYHASFSATGALTSYTISGSGNGAFDAVAQRLGAKCGSVPAPGKAVSLSGSLTFSP